MPTVIKVTLLTTYNSPPFSARVRSFFDNIYMFFGLYIVSLFSVRPPYFQRISSPANIPSQFDPYTAAQMSSFNIQNRSNSRPQRPRWGSGGSTKKGPGGGGPGSGGKGPWGGGGGSGGKKFGTVDDVRGPECKSCG
jgi:hypothetical protein